MPLPFTLTTDLVPQGDQPRVIAQLVEGYRGDRGMQCLLGVTGSGKTFTMAHVIKELGLPTLVLSHNKTLAAQLYSEFRDFFANNAVEYFVSYYDYYQPEAYIPARDIFIEKDAGVNDDLDRLRLSATTALRERDDVIIVSSVSCIYGLGDPDDYSFMILTVERLAVADREALLRRLIDMQYDRGDFDFQRGRFRVRGETLDVFPAYEESAYRIELSGDRVEHITRFDPLTGELIAEMERLTVYPAKHFVMPQERIREALVTIEAELEKRHAELLEMGKVVEAQRLRLRTNHDMELLRETGMCPGIENYSRHFTGLPPGMRPYCLLDYFRDDWLLIIDESHVTLPQVRGMYHGDFSRKKTLVEHGFRLPSALDNRPMTFDEFQALLIVGGGGEGEGEAPAEPLVRPAIGSPGGSPSPSSTPPPVIRGGRPRTMFVSATPGPWELEHCQGAIFEQIIRPTGLVDPAIEIRPTQGQIPDLLAEIRARAGRGERALVTTLTKRLAEEVNDYLREAKVKAAYLHSDINAFERVEILRDLRSGLYDAVVGVNLLREGLDLPEVTLVAILDADKEGFLRSATSLIQTIGRGARNVDGMVILYADRTTDSMRRAIDETDRRRVLQVAHNQEHGITPQTIRKAIKAGIEAEISAKTIVRRVVRRQEDDHARQETLHELERAMFEAAEKLDFESAAQLRDRIALLRGETPAKAPRDTRRGKYQAPKRASAAGKRGKRPSRGR